MNSRRVWPAVLFALIVCMPCAAHAQVLIALVFGDKVSSPRFQLGLNVSLAFSGFQGLRDKPRRSFGIGMYGELRLSEHFRLQPELLMKMPTGGKEIRPSAAAYPFEPNGDPTYDSLVEDSKATRELEYIALPVLVKWVYGRFGVSLGPQLGILRAAEDTISQKVDGQKLSLVGSIEDDLKRFDFGATGGFEVAFHPEQLMHSLRVRAKGYMGLMDVVKDNPHRPMRNWSFMIGMDVPIGGSSGEKKPKPGDKAAKPTDKK